MPKSAKATYTFLLFLGYLGVYFLIQSFVKNNQIELLTVLDKNIPFIPGFVWVYHTLILGIFLTMVYLIQDRKLFMTTFWACVLASAVMSIIHVTWPAIYPRQAIMPIDLSSWLVELTRQYDGASNTFPSAHVTFSWLMFLSVRRTKISHEKSGLTLMFFLWAIFISLSTLAIKQHFIVDVLSGVLTSFMSFYVSVLFIGKHKLLRPTYL